MCGNLRNLCAGLFQQLSVLMAKWRLRDLHLHESLQPGGAVLGIVAVFLFCHSGTEKALASSRRIIRKSWKAFANCCAQGRVPARPHNEATRASHGQLPRPDWRVTQPARKNHTAKASKLAEDLGRNAFFAEN